MRERNFERKEAESEKPKVETWLDKTGAAVKREERGREKRRTGKGKQERERGRETAKDGGRSSK